WPSQLPIVEVSLDLHGLLQALDCFWFVVTILHVLLLVNLFCKPSMCECKHFGASQFCNHSGVVRYKKVKWSVYCYLMTGQNMTFISSLPTQKVIHYIHQFFS
ncbi:hypothetical protein R6Q59_036154, partial [Mikania micrantha]